RRRPRSSAGLWSEVAHLYGPCRHARGRPTKTTSRCRPARMTRGHDHPRRGVVETYAVPTACSWSARARRELLNPGSRHLPPRSVEHYLARQRAKSGMVVAAAAYACLRERATSALGPHGGHSSTSVLMVLLTALACDPPSAYALVYICRETLRP